MLVTKPRSHERTTEVKQGHPQSAIQMETSPGRKRGLCPTRKEGRSAEGSRALGDSRAVRGQQGQCPLRHTARRAGAGEQGVRDASRPARVASRRIPN